MKKRFMYLLLGFVIIKKLIRLFMCLKELYKNNANIQVTIPDEEQNEFMTWNVM